MTFEDYLISKKIDGKAFKAAEPEVYKNWDAAFAQMHPHSFTAQKLYLINPIRLKYTLTPKNISEPKEEALIGDASNQNITPTAEIKSEGTETKPPQISKPSRPVFKSKPKIN